MGWNNILDFVGRVIEYIPLLNYPLGLGLRVVRAVFSFLSFYYLYAVVITLLNILYQAFLYSAHRYRPDARNKPYEAIIGIVVSCLLPLLVSSILIDWDLVVSLYLPFHVAATLNHVCRAHRFIQYEDVRNFILLVLLTPVLRAPLAIGALATGLLAGNTADVTNTIKT